MKTEHLANTILVLVLLTALGGLYFIYQGPGRAFELPAEVQTDALGFCCCGMPESPFREASTKLSSELFPSDCAIICHDHGADSLGQC